MPLYFAYGANMDIAAMRHRCPASTPVGPARLQGHRLFIMGEGWASVAPCRGAIVHGLLWNLAFADIHALDRFEDVEGGRYARVVRPVSKPVGAVRAMVYVGRTTVEGAAQPGYMESVIASARLVGLPPSYIDVLTKLLPNVALGRQSGAGGSLAPGPVPGVRLRFATPFDRV